MTPNMKVKHAIEVLKELEHRYDGSLTVEDAYAVFNNLEDLRRLLEKPHKTDGNRGKCRTDEALDLANRLLSLIRQRKNNLREPNINQWAVDMETIHRLDKRTYGQLEEIIDWCQQDEFWQDNILSPAKLRKQLDKLELKMAKDKHWRRMRSVSAPVTGKTAKQKYMESIDGKDQGNNA